jgi:hypothetical protein
VQTARMNRTLRKMIPFLICICPVSFVGLYDRTD